MKNSVMHQKDEMSLRVLIADMQLPEGDRYQAVMVNGNFPAIVSEKTGKTFCFHWQDLLELAIEQGVDNV